MERQILMCMQLSVLKALADMIPQRRSLGLLQGTVDISQESGKQDK